MFAALHGALLSNTQYIDRTARQRSFLPSNSPSSSFGKLTRSAILPKCSNCVDSAHIQIKGEEASKVGSPHPLTGATSEAFAVSCPILHPLALHLLNQKHLPEVNLHWALNRQTGLITSCRSQLVHAASGPAFHCNLSLKRCSLPACPAPKPAQCVGRLPGTGTSPAARQRRQERGARRPQDGWLRWQGQPPAKGSTASVTACCPGARPVPRGLGRTRHSSISAPPGAGRGSPRGTRRTRPRSGRPREGRQTPCPLPACPPCPAGWYAMRSV